MLLNRLSLLEKETFVSLCLYAAEANGNVVEKEYEMIEEYCKEMGIAFFDARNIKTYDEIIEIFKESSYSNKKIVVLEILGLLYADDVYDGDEKNFISDFAKRIDVDIDIIQTVDDLVKKYISISKEIIELVE